MAESVIERIDLLNELAFELRGKDPKEAWDLAKEAYRLSTEGIFADHPYLRGTIDSEVAQRVIWLPMDNRMKRLPSGNVPMLSRNNAPIC